MAIATQNVVYLGQPGSSAAGGGQYASLESGARAHELVGIATFIGDGASTTATLNWIDGVQTPFQLPVFLPVLSVTAPATIGGVANQAVYSGVGSYGQLRVGQSITFAGFANGGNNGAFTIVALTTSSIQVLNAGSVAESNPAATLKFILGNNLAFALVGRAITNAAGVVDTAANTITASINTMTQLSGLITFSAAPANLATISVAVELQAAG